LTVGGLLGCTSYYEGPASEHFDGTRFFNPAPPNERGFGDFLRWQLSRKPAAWPDQATIIPGKPPARVEGNRLQVTFVGHATVLLQTEGLNILTDPIWSERASPFSWIGPKRVRSPGVSFEDLPKIDVVIVSHNHYDHLDLATLDMLWKRDRPRIIVPLGNDTLLRREIEGIAPTALDWMEAVEVGPQVKIRAVPVQHWSARGVFDRSKALWAGYLIEAPGGPIYFAGDTGIGNSWWVDRTAALHPEVRLALLPIGSYEPRWFMAYSHVNPDEALTVFEKLRARHALGIHFGTFPMADDGPDDAVKELSEALTRRAISADRFRTLETGAGWMVPPLGAR
jgi:L-ascorbate metabolism protein UlaG (beta-lactamase superfamily)